MSTSETLASGYAASMPMRPITANPSVSGMVAAAGNIAVASVTGAPETTP